MKTEHRLRVKCRLAVLLLTPVVLYLIPTDGIFNGESLCLSKQLFGVECWGCGITRAIFSVLYGRFIDAWNYNHLVVAVVPLIVALWAQEVWRCVHKLKNYE